MCGINLIENIASAKPSVMDSCTFVPYPIYVWL